MNHLKRAWRPMRAGLVAVAIGACAAPVLAQSGPAPSAAPAAGAGSLNGIWNIDLYRSSARFAERERVMRTVDGKLPPLLPSAADVLENRIKQSEAGDPWPNTLSRCLPQGTPGMLLAGSAYPVQFIESPGQVTLLFEELANFRVIRLGGRHPDEVDPTFMGDSVGHWEGDTLVVDTVGLSEETTIDQVGMPHSDQLHVVERFRRVDKDTLEIRFTIDDPKTFSRPWEARAVYKAAPPTARLSEYICENQRNARDESGKMTFDMGAKP